MAISAQVRARYSNTVQIVRSSLEHDSSVVAIGLAGDLDLAALPSVSSAIDQAIDGTPRGLVLNLSQTNSIDSSGVGLLSSFETQCRQANIMSAIVASPPELRTYLGGSIRDLVVYASVDAACAALEVAS